VPEVEADVCAAVDDGELESLDAFLDTPVEAPAPRVTGLLKLKKGLFWMKRRVVLGHAGAFTFYSSHRADGDPVLVTVRDEDVWTTDGKVHMLIPVGVKLREHVWRTTRDPEGISYEDFDAWVKALPR
jgi:hypothetical protein